MRIGAVEGPNDDARVEYDCGHAVESASGTGRERSHSLRSASRSPAGHTPARLPTCFIHGNAAAGLIVASRPLGTISSSSPARTPISRRTLTGIVIWFLLLRRMRVCRIRFTFDEIGKGYSWTALGRGRTRRRALRS